MCVHGRVSVHACSSKDGFRVHLLQEQKETNVQQTSCKTSVWCWALCRENHKCFLSYEMQHRKSVHVDPLLKTEKMFHLKTK